MTVGLLSLLAVLVLAFLRVPLAFALLSIAAGILMIVNPFGTTEMLMIFGGAALCLEGVLQALSAFMFKTE